MEAVAVLIIVALIIYVVVIISLAISKTDSKHEEEEARKRTEKKAQEDREMVLAQLLERAKFIGDKKTAELIEAGEYNEPLPTPEELDSFKYIYKTIIAGINFRKNIGQYKGDIEAMLVPEPSNPHDPNAIKVEVFLEGAHLGYIPSGETENVRDYVKNHFPCRCKAHIDECTDETDGHKYYTGELRIYKQ